MREFKHPLSLLRFVVDMTQAEFGAAIGVSESYVKAIELGQRTLSANVIDAITAQFGVGSEFFEKPLPENQNKLKSEAFFLWQQVEYWRTYFARVHNVDSRDVVAELHIPQIEALVEAAVEKGNAIALLMSLDRWISSAAQEFGLAEAVKDPEASGREQYVYHTKEVVPLDPFHGLRFAESRNWKNNIAEVRSELDTEKEAALTALRDWMKSEDFTGVPLDEEYVAHLGPLLPRKVAQFLGSELGSVAEKEKYRAAQEVADNARKTARVTTDAARKSKKKSPARK